ncbi:MAG: hypothetical protein AB1454_00475 [Candidatus Auribacterota bacterium]
MAETTTTNHTADNNTAVHNSTTDKIIMLVCAALSGAALCAVACGILHYAWYVGLLYFIGMFVWVILFFNAFNFTLAGNNSDTANE